MNKRTPRADAATPTLIYVEAYTMGSWDEGLRCAEVIVNPEFFQQVRELQALCVERNLSEVRCFGSPESWGPADVVDELRLNFGELVATTSRFWFAEQPKHRECGVETRALDLDDILAKIASNGDGGRLVFGEDDELEGDLDDMLAQQADADATS
jgi:hypothetical protein